LKNEESAELFNLVLAHIRNTAPLQWLFASSALVIAARLGGVSPAPPLVLVVRQAVEDASRAVATAQVEVLTAVSRELLDLCSSALKAAGDVGPLLVFPAIKHAAQAGPGVSPTVVAVRALRAALEESGVAFDAPAFSRLEAASN